MCHVVVFSGETDFRMNHYIKQKEFFSSVYDGWDTENVLPFLNTLLGRQFPHPLILS